MKKFALISTLLLLVIIGAYLVLADIESVTLDLADYTNTSNATINFTFTPLLNGTAGTVVANATLYGNWSEGWHANQTNQTVLSNATQGYINLSNSILDEGIYLWNVYVCDNGSNCSFADNNKTITVDRTAPTVSLSCSPSSVYTGESVTCTCTASDATSDVASYSYALSSSTSSSASQTTSSAGTFTETCTVSDYAGNSGSATASYTINTRGGGGCPPGGCVPLVKTYNIGTLKEAGVTKEVKVDEKVKFVSEEKEYSGTVDEVTETTAKLTISTQTFTLNIGDVKKLDLDEDDVYEASVTLVGIAQSKAELTFKAISEAVPIEEEFEEELCGNDVVDEGENCENCPTDVKCAVDEECKEGVCEKKEVAPPKAKLTWLWITIGALAVIGIVVYLTTKKKK